MRGPGERSERPAKPSTTHYDHTGPLRSSVTGAGKRPDWRRR